MQLGGWRKGRATVGAISLVAVVALITVAVLGALTGGDDDQDALLDTGRGTSTTTTTEARTRRITPTTGRPDVLGDVITRDVTGSTTTTVVAAPTTSGAGAPAGGGSTGGATPTTGGPAPATPPPTAAPTSTTAPPPTTTPPPSCRNSTDPACGPLVWDPEPGPYEVEVVEVSVPLFATVGEPVTLAVDYVERAGADAIGACATWTIDAPGVPNVSTCEAVNHACGRHGPHDPPAPETDRVRVQRRVTFTASGEYEVRVGGHTATHLADGCANPYLASWSRTYLIIVEEAS